jgi:hypothetical protein
VPTSASHPSPPLSGHYSACAVEGQQWSYSSGAPTARASATSSRGLRLPGTVPGRSPIAVPASASPARPRPQSPVRSFLSDRDTDLNFSTVESYTNLPMPPRAGALEQRSACSERSDMTATPPPDEGWRRGTESCRRRAPSASHPKLPARSPRVASAGGSVSTKDFPPVPSRGGGRIGGASMAPDAGIDMDVLQDFVLVGPCSHPLVHVHTCHSLPCAWCHVT